MPTRSRAAAGDTCETSGATASEAATQRRLNIVVGFVLVAGTVLLGAHVAEAGITEALGSHPGELLLFAGLVVICELRPLGVARNGDVDEIVMSTAFVFAMLLAFGAAPAMLVQAVASLIADTSAHKPSQKTLFNVGQYWIAWGGSGAVFWAVSGEVALSSGGSWSARQLAAVLAAGTTYFVLNNALVGSVIGVATSQSIMQSAAQTIRRQARHDWVLLALAAIVVVVAARNLVLLPLLLLPVLAVWRSAAITLEKEHQASHDALTNLPNRWLFGEEVTAGLATAARNGTLAAVLLIDLDRFKEVNDTLGHQAGDELLKAIGPRIRTSVPASATIARLGGDEFGLLLTGLSTAVEANAIAEAIVEALRQPFLVDDFRLDIGASVGVALYPQHGHDGDALLQRADVAMYLAKEATTSVELYDLAKDRNSLRRLALLGDLRAALFKGQLTLHYQPKVTLATGAVDGVEALVRWTHPDHGPIPPSEFVPLAEHTGLIRPLTSFVLEEAVAQARRWIDEGLGLHVAINLSARNLNDPNLATEIVELLQRYDVPPSYLHCEITESSVMEDPIKAERTLDSLNRMGVRLAIDDFGTGYSSLAYLARLPVNELKVDKSFVTNMAHDERARVIVRSTIDLARNLGLKVTAEGVETPRSLELLREARCDGAQGYLIARPMPADDLTRWINDRLEHPADPAASPQRSAPPHLVVLPGMAVGGGR